MSIYTSTYLYIKQHSITGKLYFGKTSKWHPESYLGSGVHWLRHINKHGKEHVITLWYCVFYDIVSCSEFAVNFSNQENIVESNCWLNLKIENGLDGGAQSKASIEQGNIKRRQYSPSIAAREAIGAFWRGTKRNTIQCPHCDKIGSDNTMPRWHFDNCKLFKSQFVT